MNESQLRARIIQILAVGAAAPWAVSLGCGGLTTSDERSPAVGSGIDAGNPVPRPPTASSSSPPTTISSPSDGGDIADGQSTDADSGGEPALLFGVIPCPAPSDPAPFCGGGCIRFAALPTGLQTTTCEPQFHGASGTVISADARSTVVECTYHCVGGRQPAGLVAASTRAGGAMAAFFAANAYLEAASVPAFQILRRELHALGAPRSLLRACSRAARDEKRHARATFALARRFGARPDPLAIFASRARSVEEIAVENVTEGCVRETFAAVLATWRATAAKDPQVRQVMARIARDETRHAALAWSIARFLAQRLDAAAMERVDDARARAVEDVLRVAAHGAPEELVAGGILPGPALLRALADQSSAVLWAQGLAS